MVTRDDFTVPRDVQVLRMEKELLALENELLRARERDVVPRDEFDRALQRLRDKHAADTAERRARFASVPHDQLDKLMRAEEALATVVTRLHRSPPRALRKWEGWADLVRRYTP